MKKRALSLLLTLLLTFSAIPMVPASAATTVKALSLRHMPTITQYMEQGNGYTSYTFDDNYNFIPFFYYTTDFSGLELNVVYSDNTSAVYSYDNDYDTFNGLDVTIDDGQDYTPWGVGTHTITVEIGGKTTTFTVSVKITDVQKVEIVKSPTKLSYMQGVDGIDYGTGDYYYGIDLTGTEIKVTYKNGTTAVLAADEYDEYGGYDLNYTDDQFDSPWGIGTHTVTVSFCGKTTTFNVSVIESNVQKIEVTKAPTKTKYMQDVDSMDYYGVDYYFMDLTGMELKVTYTNGTSKTITVPEDFDGTLDGYYLYYDDDQLDSPWGLGTHTETISYCGKTTSLNVSVVASNISSISISKQPTKTDYLQNVDGYDMGEFDPDLAGNFYYELNLTGMEITVYYNDGTHKAFTVEDDSNGFLNGSYMEAVDTQYDTPWGLGNHTATINYLGKSTQITVNVVEAPEIDPDFVMDGSTVIDYVGDGGSITIPEQATKIQSEAFSFNETITDVTIGKNITEIESNAFIGCTNLTSYTVDPLNENYSSSDGVLFTKDMTEIVSYPIGKVGPYTIPDGVAAIDFGAFANCVNLTAISFPSSLSNIPGFTFVGAGLESLIIPEGVLTIGDNAFWGCTNLTSVSLPKSLLTMGSQVFMGCSMLQQVNIADGATFELGESAFIGCTNLTEFKFPDTMTSISDGPFQQSGIKQIVLPSSMKSLYYAAFWRCPYLTDVLLMGDNCKIYDGTFSIDPELKRVIIPGTGHIFGSNVFSDSNNVTVYGVPGSSTETYCSQNGVAFKPIETVLKKDSATGIEALTNSAEFESGSDLTVNKLTEGTNYAEVKALFPNLDKLNVFSVSLLKDSTSVMPEDGLTVKIPVPEGWDAKECKVYKIVGGTKTDVGATVYDGMLQFVTTDLGTFAVANDTIPGDVNDDGVTDLMDVTTLSRYIAGWQVACNMESVDVNGDRLVDLMDVTLLSRFIAGWAVTIY